MRSASRTLSHRTRRPGPAPSCGCRGAAGFSLIELLIASALGVLILIAAYSVYESGQASYTRTERRTDLQQNARSAMDSVTRQVRLAGYAQLNSVRNAIVIGTANVLVIRGDVRLAGVPSPGVDTVYGVRTQANADCPTPPCLMSHAPEALGQNVYTANEARLPLAFGISSITLLYFDANNQPLVTPLDGQATYPPSSTPVDLSGGGTAARDSVHRVRITITAAHTRPYVGPGGAGPQTYTLVEDIRIRNRN